MDNEWQPCHNYDFLEFVKRPFKVLNEISKTSVTWAQGES